MKIDEGFLARMREATQILQSAGPMAATEAIQRALHGMPASPESEPVSEEEATVTQPFDTAKNINPFRRNQWAGKWTPSADRQPVEDIEDVSDVRHGKAGRADKAGHGKFLSRSQSNAAGRRNYKLYVPRSYVGQPMPLVVMLHGCKQNPDDFATGTGMNLLAEEQGFLVLYPEQMQSANGSNCWNWFQPNDQKRDAGEPSLIADMTRTVIEEFHIDRSRVYVAGLSAGGAMAAVMGATYPDIYAAIGVHSGLPYRVAHDVPSAFGAMNGGLGKTGMPSKRGKKVSPLSHVVPIVVFHGDRDTTVHPANGEQAISQCLRASPGSTDAVIEESGQSGGRFFTRRIYKDKDGRPVGEHWLVHGAGHAWLGGESGGSYTDTRGPKASREMLRFFLSHTLQSKQEY
ncbi:alpha/beta hydrolase family esterase [Noviherbaspirillum saxi]|uniref:PHB depolymerase esterase n=1 Tax=Noviherbaspirillum saxi TaxID=2320863 RepID=A0A3A3FI85_9BURK|nr:PHB depolymerase family esterase [Noviherbaspirillum saxi]RJF94977.1 PHB depolymerase esterase [Noviherbaspirillum saxi]